MVETRYLFTLVAFITNMLFLVGKDALRFEEENQGVDIEINCSWGAFHF